MKEPRRPDLFFAGHPRSGSGLLDSYLAGHPDIYMARKELHRFGSDLCYHTPPRTMENYLSHFSACPTDAVRAGEASTWYLISQRAAQEIAGFAPDGQVLMMLREPVSWLASLHSHLVFTGDEDRQNFADALDAEPDRLAGRGIPRWSQPACALHYRHLVRYAEQVQRYFDVFGRDRVHVMILDDFKKDSADEYRKVLEFLGLRTDFPGLDDVLSGSARSRNSNRTVHSVSVRNFIKNPARWRILEGVEETSFPGGYLAIRAMRRLNIRYVERSPIDSDLRQELSSELRPRVDDLESVLGRKLGWCRSA